jgi:hypothetical protein
MYAVGDTRPQRPWKIEAIDVLPGAIDMHPDFRLPL